MHRMRRFFVLFGLAAFSYLTYAAPAKASLLKPNAGRAYPDIAADINGKVNYTYDASSGTGVFHVTNTPYLIAGGTTSNQEYTVLPNTDSGIRMQELKLTLDSSGNLVPSAGNMFEVWGTIVAGGETYSGLLLKGTPTGFGFQDLDPVGVQGADVFDVTLDITGGSLASFFGTDAYMRIAPELLSTFAGRFDEDFTAVKATSNTRSYSSPHPFPVPEPGSVVVLLMGVVGLTVRHRAAFRRRTTG